MYDELKELNHLINRKQERIDEMRSALTSMSAPIGLHVQSTHEDRLAKMMCKIIIAENELDEMIDDYADKKRKAQAEIYTLPNEDWQDILYMYYIEGKKLDEIAEVKGISVAGIKMKKQRALKCLKKS